MSNRILRFQARFQSSASKGLTIINSTSEVDDTKADFQAMYEALNEPVAVMAVGPQTRRSLKLSPDYLQKLRQTFEVRETDDAKRLTDVKSNLSLGLANPSLYNVTELIYLNAKTNRVAEAQESFDTLAKMGVTPDLVAYNNLLDAYASSDKPKVALEIFEKLELQGLKPDLVTYSTLIKMCVKSRDIDLAFKLYSKMKKLEIWPNQIIFTMLIQGCLNSNQIDRAWTIFNHMKAEIDMPDTICYSLMINACARTQDAERALDIFQEMAEYNVPSTTSTYNGLIRACGLRKDYYLEAFSLLEQMVNAGFEPNIHTYRILAEITAANKDIVRARVVWNDYGERLDPANLYDKDLIYNTNPLLPDTTVFSQMLRAYFLYLRQAMNFKQRGTELIKPEIASSEKSFGVTKVPRFTERVLPLLDISRDSDEDFKIEAEAMWALTLDMCSKKHLVMTGELWARRLDLLTLDRSVGGIKKSLEYFDLASDYKVIPSFKAYKAILMQISVSSEGFETFGDTFFKRLLAWDQQLEIAMPKGLTYKEKELIRTNSRRTPKPFLDCFLLMAHSSLEANDLNRAVKYLQEAQLFRQPYYLPVITLKMISRILSAAQRQADMGDLEPLRAISEICPKSNDPLEQVHAVLRQKTIPSNWWGWKAIGAEGPEKRAMIKQHQKVNSQAVQREMGLRSKAAKQKTAEKKESIVFRGYVE